MREVDLASPYLSVRTVAGTKSYSSSSNYPAPALEANVYYIYSLELAPDESALYMGGSRGVLSGSRLGEKRIDLAFLWCLSLFRTGAFAFVHC